MGLRSLAGYVPSYRLCGKVAGAVVGGEALMAIFQGAYATSREFTDL